MPVEEVQAKPPAKPDDVPLRIYSNPICPYAQRARLIAAATGVNFEVIDIHLKKKPEWFLSEINPYGLVPVIEHNGHIIRESAVTFDYIDEVFGDKSLWPTDPYKKARAKLVLNDFGSQFTSNYYKYYFRKNDDETSITILKFIKSLEKEITDNGGLFVSGPEVSAIDLLIWPWFERLDAFVDIIPEFSGFYSQDKTPVLYGWVQRMFKVDAVKQTLLPKEVHQHFFQNAKDGNHDYSRVDVSGKGVKIYVKQE